MALAPIRTHEFSLPRGAFTNSVFRFYSIDFYVTHRFFVTFFPEESNVPLVPPFPLTPYIKGKDHHL